MIKKECRHFNISVEGINCEKMYFEHLAKLINSSDRNTYNLKVDPRKMSPLEYAKRNAYKPVDKRKGNKLFSLSLSAKMNISFWENGKNTIYSCIYATEHQI